MVQVCDWLLNIARPSANFFSIELLILVVNKEVFSIVVLCCALHQRKQVFAKELGP